MNSAVGSSKWIRVDGQRIKQVSFDRLNDIDCRSDGHNINKDVYEVCKYDTDDEDDFEFDIDVDELKKEEVDESAHRNQKLQGIKHFKDQFSDVLWTTTKSQLCWHVYLTRIPTMEMLNDKMSQYLIVLLHTPILVIY